MADANGDDDVIFVKDDGPPKSERRRSRSRERERVDRAERDRNDKADRDRSEKVDRDKSDRERIDRSERFVRWRSACKVCACVCVQSREYQSILRIIKINVILNL